REGDDYEVQERAERVAEVAPSCLRFGMDAEIGYEEPRGREQERTPQRDRKRYVRTAERQQRAGRGHEEEPEERERALLRDVHLRAAAKDGEVLADAPAN